MRAQTNLDMHNPDVCKSQPEAWGRNADCPEMPMFAGNGARVCEHDVLLEYLTVVFNLVSDVVLGDWADVSLLR